MYKLQEIAKIKTTWNEEVSERSGVAVAWTSRCNPAKEDTCGLCQERESLDQQIHQMEEALATLKAMRASHNTKINTTHDPLSRLPIELVTNIFMYLRPLPMEVTYYLDVDNPDDIAKSMKTPLLLGAVCRAWRTFAWSIPWLWTTISVNVYNETEGALDTIRQWLARSGQLPLCIYLYTARRRLDGGRLSPHPYGNEPYVERLMDTINEYSGRWFYLNLDIPKRFMLRVHCSGLEAPMLETLSLQMLLDDDIEGAELDSGLEKIQLGKTPNLTKIYISCSLTFGDIDMEWASVKHAEGSYPTLETCCYLLSETPVLTHLTLEEIVVDIYELPSSIVRHQNLLSLQINSFCSGEGPDVLLFYLDLPALEDLGIFTNHRSQWDSIHGFLRRSSCNLKKFKLNISSGWMENKKELIALLDKMPSLEILELECVYPQSNNPPIPSQLPITTTTQEMNAEDQRLFLPNLKKIHIKLGYLCHPTPYFLDLLLHPNDSITTSLGRSDRTDIISSDTLCLTPLYIYYLLDMETQRTLHPIIESAFESKTSVTNLYPFVDFLRQSLHCYVYDSSARSSS